MSKSALRDWVARDKLRPVVVASPLPPNECVGRLAKATTTRKSGWYLDSHTATRPDPLFHGTVEPSRIRIGLFKNMLGRGSPVWFDVQVDPGPDGGTVLAGTIGSSTAPLDAVRSLVLPAIFAVLALLSFVIGVVIIVSGHFNLAVGAAIGIPVLVAVSILVSRDSFTWEDEGQVQPLLRTIHAVLDAITEAAPEGGRVAASIRKECRDDTRSSGNQHGRQGGDAG